MVHYYFKLFIPSISRKVSFRDITIRDWININKSILNNDYDELIECFDLIIDSCCIEQGLQFTLLDKIIILLSIRSFSISNFCTVTIKDNEVNEDFNHQLELNNIINALYNLPIEHAKTVLFNNVKVTYGLPCIPLKNTTTIDVSKYIHSICVDDTEIVNKLTSEEDKQLIINTLDVQLFYTIIDYAKKLNEIFIANPLYVITSPWSHNKILVNQRMSMDLSMYDLLKLLYTENLHTLYRAIYKFNQELKIPPSYTENLIPVEKDLLWGYFIKDQRDAEAEKMSKTKTGSFVP